jgi:hypothetical protein
MLRWSGISLGAYLLVDLIFAYVTARAGLVTPGAPDLLIVALGGAYLLLRLFVRAAVPGIVAFAIAREVGERIATRVRIERS